MSRSVSGEAHSRWRKEHHASDREEVEVKPVEAVKPATMYETKSIWE
jgi:hypothetical protein